MFGYHKGKNELVIIYATEKIFAAIINGKEIMPRNDFSINCELEKILLWGHRQKATSAKVLMPSAVYEFKLDIGQNIEFEEQLSAVAYETASLSGASSETIRPAILTGNCLKGYRHNIICSVFQLDTIKNVNHNCKRRSLRFNGIGGLQQALLVYHFSHAEHKDEILLFFRRDSAFAAIPEHGGIVFRNIPFGLPDKGAKAQWQARVERRLSSLSGRRVQLYLEQECADFKNLLKKTANPETISECLLRDILPNLGNITGDAGISSTASFCLTGVPPRIKDPREAGTVICLILIGVTSVILLFQILQLNITKNTLNEALERKTTAGNNIKSQKSQLASSKKQIKKLKTLCALLEKKKHLDRDFLVVLNLLARYRLKYTKIKAIKQENTGIVISGVTHWQPDLSKFFSHFEKQLTRKRLILLSEGLEKSTNGLLLFKCRISKVQRHN